MVMIMLMSMVTLVIDGDGDDDDIGKKDVDVDGDDIDIDVDNEDNNADNLYHEDGDNNDDNDILYAPADFDRHQTKGCTTGSWSKHKQVEKNHCSQPSIWALKTWKKIANIEKISAGFSSH